MCIRDSDLSKSESEAFITEISIVYQEIDYALKNLNKWMRPHKVPQTPTNIPSKNYILPEPYGVVAILSPWNYPVNLALVPLVGALAAGNSVILKTSRSSLQTSELLRELITKYFPAEVVYVVDPAIDYDESVSYTHLPGTDNQPAGTYHETGVNGQKLGKGRTCLLYTSQP